jgi:hypothetical protein
MHTIGISITRDRIFSVALDASTPSLRVAAAVSVPCSEPFGTAGDAVSLSEALREALPGVPFPGAVLTLPPPITFLRPMTLPVTDRPRAKAIHLAELEGNLPIEDEDILSDLLPAPPDGTGLFFAVAARKTFVESASEQFGAAGIRMDRVVTDPVALLLLAPDAAGTTSCSCASPEAELRRRASSRRRWRTARRNCSSRYVNPRRRPAPRRFLSS